MKIKELMTDHADWIEAGTSVRDAASLLRDKGIGCLPIGENDRLIGMVTDRDICCRAVADGLDASETPVRDVMTEKVSWCYEDQEDGDAIALMREKNIRHLPVMNRDKRIVGVLSLGDLAFGSSTALGADVIALISRDVQHLAKSA